jgi:osomolarity two-component system sensor histidine kinase NIK1
MCSSLTDQVRSIANVTTAVAKGDLTQKIEIQVEGEMSTLKGTVNSMVDQLSAFASEVTRMALEVGTQGILGGQAKVEGVQGTWADLTRNVNVCADSSIRNTSLTLCVYRKWLPISQTKCGLSRR